MSALPFVTPGALISISPSSVHVGTASDPTAATTASRNRTGSIEGCRTSTFAAGMGLEPEDVVAFGDMPNDLPMLTWAGTSYAMANGHADVRGAADHVAPGNDEDGVAVVLERVFGL